MGKGDPRKKQANTTKVPGGSGKGAGAGSQSVGGRGGQPDDGGPAPSAPLRWEFDHPTEEASESWKSQPIWGKIDRGAIYLEATNIGSLGRVPREIGLSILRALESRPGLLYGEILEVRSQKLIRVVLVLD